MQPGREPDVDIQYREVFAFLTPVIYYVTGRGPSGTDDCSHGVTVLFTTGNNGEGEGDCMGSDGLLKFRPPFPATCDYVTAVGGTTDVEPESAAKFSGGSFSNYFSRPRYQLEAVPAYLQKLGNQHQGLYNAQGRGVPDLSA
ncbi:peptidase S8/S53 domain-containing protein [Lactarius quietus]|nr:peptidase S8/S53 domain-containing protein [Lactarius quietus]